MICKLFDRMTVDSVVRYRRNIYESFTTCEQGLILWLLEEITQCFTGLKFHKKRIRNGERLVYSSWFGFDTRFGDLTPMVMTNLTAYLWNDRCANVQTGRDYSSDHTRFDLQRCTLHHQNYPHRLIIYWFPVTARPAHTRCSVHRIIRFRRCNVVRVRSITHL